MVTLRVAVKGSMSKWRSVPSDLNQGSVLGPVLFNTFLETWTVRLSAPSACLLTTTSCVVRRHTGGKGCHPEGPWQAWDVGPCKPHQVQQGQVQGPAHGLGKSQAKMQAGQRMDWEQPWGEGLWGVGWWEAQYDLAVYAHSPEGQPYPELHQKKHGQQVEGSDSATLLW